MSLTPLKRRILIMGSSGFIGRHLTKYLVELGYSVLGVDLIEDPHFLGEKFVQGQVKSLDWSKVWAWNPQDVIHLAGPSLASESFKDVYAEVEGSVGVTAFLIEQLRSRPQVRLLFFSSAAVYGNQDIPRYHEDLACRPMSPYGICKLASEQLIEVSAGQFGFQYLVLRPFSIYGDGLKKQVIYDLAKRFLTEDAPICINSTGKELRDFVHVDDCVRITEALLAREWKGTVVNIGTGVETALETVVASIYAATGARKAYVFKGIDRPGNPNRLIASTQNLERLGLGCAISTEVGLSQVLARVTQDFLTLIK